jgi:hypothetical protein
MIRASTYTRAVDHDRHGGGDGEVTAQRAPAIATREPGTPGPANVRWVHDGSRDVETALTVARSSHGRQAPPLVDDKPAKRMARWTTGADPDAISWVARARAKGRGRFMVGDRIAGRRQRHGELARV